MCTVSWLTSSAGYEVFFNRDERPSRPARGPDLAHSDGIAYLAPYDVEAGGTWIAVNQFGVTVSMTNQYPEPAPPPPADRISRGLLLTSLVHARSLPHVQYEIDGLALERYEPFAIAAFAPETEAAIYQWDGKTLHVRRHAEPGFVLTSSGATPPGLEQTRTAVFERAVRRNGWSADTLEGVHGSHLPERGMFSVCMHRDVAQTVSYSHIAVDAEDIAFRYAPGPPCATPVEGPVHLQRTDHLARS